MGLPKRIIHIFQPLIFRCHVSLRKGYIWFNLLILHLGPQIFRLWGWRLWWKRGTVTCLCRWSTHRKNGPKYLKPWVIWLKLSCLMSHPLKFKTCRPWKPWWFQYDPWDCYICLHLGDFYGECRCISKYIYIWNNNISYMDPMGLENDHYFSLLR